MITWCACLCSLRLRYLAIGFAFLISALASATFVAVSALVDHLDGAAS